MIAPPCLEHRCMSSYSFKQRYNVCFIKSPVFEILYQIDERTHDVAFIILSSFWVTRLDLAIFTLQITDFEILTFSCKTIILYENYAIHLDLVCVFLLN